jgi:uncharacterized caspase-like protein
VLRAAIALLLLLLLSSAAHAGKRLALVIGNSSYRFAGELANPKNDATDVAAALSARGFQVIRALDVDRAALEGKVREFATALQGAEVGVFFYAGHGLQVSGQNYIVPTGAELLTPAALELEMMRLDVIQRIMEREAPTNVLFLDACRDNPLARNLAQAMGTRSTAIGRGLAPVESGFGTLISFSTQPGNVALDGTGRNSPYAGALVKHMSSSNDDLSGILIAVRNDVMRETQRRQVPWENSALTGRFYFNATQEPVAPQPQKPAAAPSKPAATAAAPAAPARDAQPSLLGQYGDWGAYTASAGGNKVCFALAKPNTTKTEPAGSRRDPPFMFVSTRPAENVKNEVSVVIGYPFRTSSEAILEVGTAKFPMYTKNSGAWIKNVAEEAHIVDAMREAPDLTVKGTSDRFQSTDQYSLKGLAQALDRIKLECK